MKSIYFFGCEKTDGSAKLKNILGGKGANLAEISNLNIPVPPGFTITTEICNYYLKNNKFPKNFKSHLFKAINNLEKKMGATFGGNANPLLVSVRSGASVSMPGMMETVLNVGLNDSTIKGLIKKTNNERFVYDSYRRLIMMYADVVLDDCKNANLREKMELYLQKYKNSKNLDNDFDLSTQDLIILIKQFKKIIYNELKIEFPENPKEQLFNAILAVFQSWNGPRAKSFRKIENIPNSWGTAVNIQCMVFGNMGKNSGTGVAFTRNPSNGNNEFYGEWLPNAQGEDVVAGIRTPYPINNASRTLQSKKLESLEESFPEIYKSLYQIKNELEKHYTDMQDIEFTIQENKLWILQTRRGKRTGAAAIKIAIDLFKTKIITLKSVLKRISPENLNEIMHPQIDTDSIKSSSLLSLGLPASPGAATGQIVFTADDAEKLKNKGKKIILVRNETSPEDIHGMHAAVGILTARGGMTSHAALVARGWGKCCIVGCNDLNIDFKNKKALIKNQELREGDWITLNGSDGKIYLNKIKLITPNLIENQSYVSLMRLVDSNIKMKVRTNADQPKDVSRSLAFGAEGIGLCRTEHMFFNPKRINIVRKMILAENIVERKRALNKLLPFQKNDFYKIFKIMNNRPTTIRLLDPPLHEFINLEKEDIKLLSKELKIKPEKLQLRIRALEESNPMLGHRGCRLGITFPEITEMQSAAIFQAIIKLKKEKINVAPEIMIPLVGSIKEFMNQKQIIINAANQENKKLNYKLKFKIGTMIELPRACLIADQIASIADFISFGTNDLTQTVYGFSRDDIGSFLSTYIDAAIMPYDPFATLDEEGVGQLIKMAIKRAKTKNPKIKIGICGEHGGDPKSIQFFSENSFDYISCSPFRIPIAKLMSAKFNL